MNDPYGIRTVEDLRAVISEPHAELEAKVADRLDEDARAFIAASPFVVLSTVDGNGCLDASPKGDEPGFTVVEDDRTLIIPDRPGNKLAFGHRNILATGRVGLLFVIPNTPESLRINGRAELTRDPELLARLAARGKPAVLAIRVRVEECFFHCGKAFIRSKLWAPESWGEKHVVSFGRMFARRKGAGAKLADAIDRSILEDYRDNL